MTLYELILAIKKGRTTKRGWGELVSAIHRLKLSNKILEELHVGLSRLPDRDIKKFIDSL